MISQRKIWKSLELCGMVQVCAKDEASKIRKYNVIREVVLWVWDTSDILRRKRIIISNIIITPM
jgi:hypothetical protein